MARIWGISDLHVDYADNLQVIEQWSDWDFQDDCLLLAGDITDRLELLGRTLAACRRKFATVAFVPGNHEFWVRGKDSHGGSMRDSLQKWDAIRRLCNDEGVTRSDFCVAGRHPVTVVPLLSWYEAGEADDGSLFVLKGGEDRTHEMWMDFHLTQWPGIDAVADFFFLQNVPPAVQLGDVITFSHFLPRQELMFQGLRTPAPGIIHPRDPHPTFNFSRVAGSSRIDAQLRGLGSILHLYGHQHRNRAVTLEGVMYVSHCMGYPRERARGHLAHDVLLPRGLWDTDTGMMILT